MSNYSFRVNLKAMEAIQLIKRRQSADLIHEEIISCGDGKLVAVLVFEKYYFRVENRAGLTVVVSNVSGVTVIKSIASGSSRGMIFNFDWGAGDSLANSTSKILKEYIIR